MKKKEVGIVASLIAMSSKAFGAPQVLYGPARLGPSMLEIGLRVLQVIIVPILFLIGIIIYLKKSKSSKMRKIITTIIFILLLVGMYFGIEVLLNMQYDVIAS